MFQVEPERVFYALGAPKDKRERQVGRRIRARTSMKSAKTEKEEAESEGKEAADASPPEQTPSSSDGTTATAASTDRTPKQTLQSLFAQAKTLLATPSTSVTARRKQDLRAFQRSVRKSLSRPDALTTTSLDAQLQDILSRMAPTPAEEPASTPAVSADAPQMSTPALQAEAASLSAAQMRVLRDALIQARENPIDPSKPYATPWRPRDYMSPFAFIPNYLEVHQKVCSAVYLRHPVARPGLGEVPTPFTSETLGLAHNWYLRRR